MNLRSGHAGEHGHDAKEELLCLQGRAVAYALSDSQHVPGTGALLGRAQCDTEEFGPVAGALGLAHALCDVEEDGIRGPVEVVTGPEGYGCVDDEGEVC